MADENIYGRKIFFVAPPYTVKKETIPALRDAEYETYIIDDYRTARSIIKQNPNSVLFVNVDIHMPVVAWIVFLKKFKEDELFRDLSIGILSSTNDDSTRQLLFSEVDPQAGLITTNGSEDQILTDIANILMLLQVKGKRQYVRANCLSDRNAKLLWTHNDKMHELKMVDISNVGSALLLPSKFRDQIQDKMIIRGAAMQIGSVNKNIDLVVYGLHDSGSNILVITLFLNAGDPNLKSLTKKYIYDTLQAQMLASINNCPLDETDYIYLGSSLARELKEKSIIERKESEEKKETSSDGQ